MRSFSGWCGVCAAVDDAAAAIERAVRGARCGVAVF
jgi:hypothetical protein